MTELSRLRASGGNSGVKSGVAAPIVTVGLRAMMADFDRLPAQYRRFWAGRPEDGTSANPIWRSRRWHRTGTKKAHSRSPMASERGFGLRR